MEKTFREWLQANYPKMTLDTHTYQMLFDAWLDGYYSGGKDAHSW